MLWDFKKFTNSTYSKYYPQYIVKNMELEKIITYEIHNENFKVTVIVRL